jgi:hypothetical protein
MVEPPKLRVGILQEGMLASHYTRDVLLWLGQQGSVELSHLITYGNPKAKDDGGWLSRALFRCIERVEQAFLARYHGGVYRDHSRRYRIDELFVHAFAVLSSISESGTCDFSEAELEKIRRVELDLLIHTGSRDLTGKVAGASRQGILELHYGDKTAGRRAPPGFWEAYQACPSSGFAIRRITPGGNEVLLRGAFDTRWFFLLNQAELFSKSHFFFKDVLKRLALDETMSRKEELFPQSATPMGAPAVRDSLGYVARMAGRIWLRLIGRVASRVFRYQDRWHLYLSFSDWRQANLTQASRVVSPTGRFLADPFVWHHNGRTFCLAEDYSFQERIGRISAFEIAERAATEPQLVLVEPFHLSFPFLFEFQGTMYLCPECSASRQIRLYRSIEFPHRWQFVKTIMSDVSAVDTMIFEKGDRWWMLTNLDLAGRGGLRSELYLFSASTPLSDSWIPHPSNPIKIDPAGGRNAGLLRDGNRLFRAGQVQGFERYGAGVRLYEITALSPERYEERLVAEIQPRFRERLLGTHHISSAGAVTVVDGYQREVV